jgi:methionyl-tRNA formyltransferase
VKIVFLGSGSFALPVLDALDSAGFRPVLVVSQPPRRRRRRGKEEPTAVHARAVAWGVDVFTPEKVNTAESLQRLRAAHAHLFVVAEYGQILSQKLLDIPRLGAINVHGSLLPRWRGATPVEAALLAGDKRTGVTIQKVVRELDAGDVLATRFVGIEEGDDAGTLRNKLSAIGGALAAEVVAAFAAGKPPQAVPQDATLVTHCRRLGRADLELDWSQDAETLARQVRAFRPQPLARTALHRDPLLGLKIVRATMIEGEGEPGVVVAASGDGVDVATGAGVLRIEELVPDARRPMAARDFINGYRISAGERFGPSGGPQERRRCGSAR